MSRASRRTNPDTGDRATRWQSRIGVIATALLHLLLLLVVMLAPPPITMTAPEGGPAGSSLQVTYIDPSLQVPSPAPPAPARPPSRKPREDAPARRRIQATPVAQPEAPVPPDTADIPAPPPEPPTAPAREVARPARRWGQPPGMRLQDPAPVNAGPARSRSTARGRRNDAVSSGPGLEVGGYQVYYDLPNETRLRAWRDQGMTELFLPLPGTRRLMVCPLEVALHRDSGNCRLVEPDAPELEAIGDARDVITMQRIYQLGEVLWSGPGAYR